MFAEATSFNLLKIKSYYHPVLLMTGTNDHTVRSRIPFWFEAAWTTHPEFNDFIKNNWNGSDGLDAKLKCLVGRLRY